MTLVLRSDKIATRNLGNINGLNGPQDYSGFLDFNRETYLYRDGGMLVPTTLDEALTFTRAGVGTYNRRDGIERTAGINEPRLHYMQDVGLSGLLMETGRDNFIRQANGPETQTVNIAASSTAALILTVIGTGSASVSGDVALSPLNATPEPIPGAASEGNSLVFWPLGPVGALAAITVTVTGSLTFMQLERSEGTYVPTSKIHNNSTNASASRAPDAARLSDAFFSQVMASDFTVVVHTVHHRQPVVPNPLNKSRMILGVSDEAGAGLFAAATGWHTDPKSRVRGFFGGSELFLDDLVPVSRSNTTVIGRSGTAMKQAKNGLISTRNTVPAAWAPTKFTLGTASPWLATSETNGIVARAVVYPRLLNDSELAAVSTSWGG